MTMKNYILVTSLMNDPLICVLHSPEMLLINYNEAFHLKIYDLLETFLLEIKLNLYNPFINLAFTSVKFIEIFRNYVGCHTLAMTNVITLKMHLTFNTTLFL